MNHEHEQHRKRARPAAKATTAEQDTIAPGQVSISAFLQRLEDPTPSGLVGYLATPPSADHALSPQRDVGPQRGVAGSLDSLLRMLGGTIAPGRVSRSSFLRNPGQLAPSGLARLGELPAAAQELLDAHLARSTAGRGAPTPVAAPTPWAEGSTVEAAHLDADVAGPDADGLHVTSRHEAVRAAIRGEVLTIADALGLDASLLEIVIDDRARSRLMAAGVNGMQEGQSVYLHPDVYRPGTEEGRYLLAHELVHVAQRKLPGRPEQGYAAAEAEATSLGMLYAGGHGLTRPTMGLSGERTAHDEPGPRNKKLLADPPGVKRTVQMLHVVYEPLAGGAVWTGEVEKKREALAMVLKDLVGPAYSVTLLDELIASQGGLSGLETTGALHGRATQNERITVFGLSAGLMVDIVAWLSAAPRNLKTLTAAQLSTLQAGVDVEDTWPELGPQLPPWATKELYSGFVGATQATRLKKLAQAKHLAKEKPGGANAREFAALEAQMLAAIRPAFLAMNAVRLDKTLAKEGAYRVLWGLPVVTTGKGTEILVARASTSAPIREALFFLIDAHANPELARSAPSAPTARKQLLDGYKARLGDRGLPADGDFVLHDGPVHNARPPLPSSMTSYPALEAPFFDTPKGQDREFVMSVAFPDVFEAFRGYVYKWELLHVAQDDIEQLPGTADALDRRGESPSRGDVLGNRLERDARYGSADVRRSIEELQGEFGPSGFGAVSLAASNAMLRGVGTVIKTFLEAAVKPQHERTMPFPKDGLYVVRCIAWPRPMDGATAGHAASAAWLPVWVRPARDMSKLRAHLDSKIAEGTVDRQKEIDDALADKSLSPEARAELENEKQRIEGVLHANGSGNGLLDQEKQGLLTAQKTAEGYQLETIGKRLAEIEQILKMRTGRLAAAKTDGSLEPVIRIPAAFVGDNGQAIRPLFEVFEQPRTGIRLTYHAVDSTTKNSGHRSGTGMTRDEAIANAIQAVLESDQGYGRGYVTLTIPASVKAHAGATPIERTIRVEKNTGALMMETVENAVLVASIAAIAAAPFTGGASLALLVPIGVVGAIPSAYRLIDRGQQGTLRFDMAMAMDIVNILGAAVGVGQGAAAGRAGLRGMPLGRGWLCLGLGNDGLGMMVAGAGVMDQIHELGKDPNLSPGLRNAMIAQIVGTQLMQIGIAAGVQLYMYGKTRQAHFGDRKEVVDHAPSEPHLQERDNPTAAERAHANEPSAADTSRQVTAASGSGEPRSLGRPWHTDAKPGLAVSDATIAAETVEMELHPEYPARLDLLRAEGFSVVTTAGDPHVEIIEVVDGHGKRLAIRRTLFVRPKMRFLDLEHEMGHIGQLKRFAEPPPTKRMVSTPNGEVPATGNQAQGILTAKQNAIAEYHNRLAEFVRLCKTTTPDVLAMEFDGIESWRIRAENRAGFGRGDNTITRWAKQHFPDIADLESQVRAAGFNLQPQTARQ